MLVTLEAVGDEVGLVLPKHILQKIGAKTGDTLKLAQTADGFSLELSNEAFERPTGRGDSPRERHILNFRKPDR
ncbi:MAG: AbrB family transcriptional regulator [Rhizobiales bacterium]|nr:AbrB family transcriptional regulator [Hyphomicrobiales bacterium]OJY06394.1 MAG: hypothetical protein BGP07_14980 [Rhizobiales bacterium 63-22]